MLNRFAFGRSLFSRIAWTVVLGFLLLHVAGYYFYGHERMVERARAMAVGLADRAVQLDALLDTQPDLLPHFQSAGFTLERVSEPRISEPDSWPHNEEVVQTVRDHLAAAGMPDVQPVQIGYFMRGGPPRLQLVIPSASGGYLRVTSLGDLGARGYASPVGVAMSLLLLLLVGLVLWLARRQTRQLGRFVSAAEQLAQGRAGPPLPEHVGPRELRRASAAFNHMQSQVMRLLEERSDMLAGVSHDLRTLCTRLSLRVEHLSDVDERDKAAHEIDLMTGILDQALTFTRDESSTEARTAVDLATLLESVADEFSDRDQDVCLQLLARPVLQAQPVAVTRLFMNLVDNALKYGGQARMELDAAACTVTDPGAGFDPEQVSLALKPYARLAAGRSQAVPGTGLGLSIAANVCRRHGWSLGFEQIHPGFRVTVRFTPQD